MGFSEFKDLFTALNGWKQNFMMFDQDRSGTVEPHEMNQAVNAMGEFEPFNIMISFGSQTVSL